MSIINLDCLIMNLWRPHPVVIFSSWNIAAVSDSEIIRCKQGIQCRQGNKDQAEISRGAPSYPKLPWSNTAHNKIHQITETNAFIAMAPSPISKKNRGDHATSPFPVWPVLKSNVWKQITITNHECTFNPVLITITTLGLDVVTAFTEAMVTHFLASDLQLLTWISFSMAVTSCIKGSLHAYSRNSRMAYPPSFLSYNVTVIWRAKLLFMHSY